MPGVNKKVTHTQTNLHLKAAGFLSVCDLFVDTNC